MPQLTAVLETCLYVDDLERAAAFYDALFALPVLRAEARMRAYDVAGRGVLLLFVRGATLEPVATPGGAIPPHDGSGPLHVAFSIERSEVQDWLARLEAEGVAVESRVDWPRGGHSLYFRDPDGHLLELATPGLWQGH